MIRTISQLAIRKQILSMLGECEKSSLRTKRAASLEKLLENWWAQIDHRDRPYAAKLLMSNLSEIYELVALLKHQATLTTITVDRTKQS